MAGVGRNDIGHPFLHDIQLGPYGHLFQGYRRLHFSRQVRVVKYVRVANAFVGYEFKIFSTEGVAVPRAEIRERHLVGTVDPGIELMNLAGEPIRRKPLGHCIGIQERPIDSLGSSTKYSVKPDSVW